MVSICPSTAPSNPTDTNPILRRRRVESGAQRRRPRRTAADPWRFPRRTGVVPSKWRRERGSAAGARWGERGSVPVAASPVDGGGKVTSLTKYLKLFPFLVVLVVYAVTVLFQDSRVR